MHATGLFPLPEDLSDAGGVICAEPVRWPAAEEESAVPCPPAPKAASSKIRAADEH